MLAVEDGGSLLFTPNQRTPAGHNLSRSNPLDVQRQQGQPMAVDATQTGVE